MAPGYKYNLTDTAAALGRVQLRRTPELVARRTEIAGHFNEAFRDLPLTLPAQAPTDSSHAWHLYVIRLTDEAPVDRDLFDSRSGHVTSLWTSWLFGAFTYDHDPRWTGGVVHFTGCAS